MRYTIGQNATILPFRKPAPECATNKDVDFMCGHATSMDHPQKSSNSDNATQLPERQAVNSL